MFRDGQNSGQAEKFHNASLSLSDNDSVLIYLLIAIHQLWTILHIKVILS